MEFSVWIKIFLLLAWELEASLTVEGKTFHPSKHHANHDARHELRSKSGHRLPGAKHKESRMFTKKSFAPFHMNGHPLVHIPVVEPESDTPVDNAAEAQPERGSFTIDDSGVIGAGTYEINDDGVDVDINMKIPRHPPSEKAPEGGQSPKLCPMPCPAPGQPNPPPEGQPPAPAGKPGAAPSSPTPPVSGGPSTPVQIGGSPHEAPTPVPTISTGSPKPTGSTQPTTPAGGGGGGSDFENEGLNEHNKFRQVHGVPPLALDSKMSQQAAAYAQKLAQMGTLQHASSEERQGHGENLSMGCSTNKGGQTATEAVTNWYNEVCEPGYTFGSESGSSGTGHFTQVVWKGSQKLGMGKADGEKNGMKCTYIVGRYDPAGNMMGAYADNVPKGSFDQSYCSSVSQKRSGDVSKSTTAIGADPQWLPRVNIPKEQ